MSFLLHTPSLPGLSDNGLWSAGRILWSRLHFLGLTSAGLSVRSLLKTLKVGSPPLSYCSVAVQVLTPREQTDSLQFSCEKIKTNQERDKTGNRALTCPLCSQQVELAIRVGCHKGRVPEVWEWKGWHSEARHHQTYSNRQIKQPLRNSKTQRSLESSGQNLVCRVQKRSSPQLSCNCGCQEVKSTWRERPKPTQSFSAKALCAACPSSPGLLRRTEKLYFQHKLKD